MCEDWLDRDENLRTQTAAKERHGSTRGSLAFRAATEPDGGMVVAALALVGTGTFVSGIIVGATGVWFLT